MPEQNAFVLPGGHVFVYTGMLAMTPTDDALAAVLAHEVAHVLARHSAENMSRMVLLAIPRYLLQFLDASGVTMGLGQILGEVALSLGVVMRCSRQQEAEADSIGLMLMAKSCYDPQAAIKLWQRMDQAENVQGRQPPEWLSTHPAVSEYAQPRFRQAVLIVV